MSPHPNFFFPWRIPSIDIHHFSTCWGSNKNLMDLPSKPQPFSKESAKWSQLCSPDVFYVMVQILADVRNNQKIVLSECLASESVSFVQGIIPLWLSWVVPGLVRTLTILWTQRPRRSHSRWEPWLAHRDVKLLEAGALVAQGQSRRVEPRWGHQPHPQLCWHQTGFAFQGYLVFMSLSSGHIGCLPSLGLSRTKVAAIPFIFFLSRRSVYSLVLIFCCRRCKQSSPRIWLAFLLFSWSLWMKRSSHPILYWLARVAWSATLQRDLSVSWLSRNEHHDLLEASDNEESPQVHQFTVLE